MKLDVGDVIEIGGKEATICFTANYNQENYICVAFEEEKIRYEIYKYKFEQEKLQVAKVDDKEEAKPVLKIMVEEGIDEYDIPEELARIIDNYN